MTTLTPEQARAYKLAVSLIMVAVEASGSSGAPSGIVYAALNAHGMKLSTYHEILSSMVDLKLITVDNHVIRVGTNRTPVEPVVYEEPEPKFVTIYFDPLTEKSPEGRAMLLYRVGSYDPIDGRLFERWRVRFVGDQHEVSRNILMIPTPVVA